MTTSRQHRILVVDDNTAIHADFAKILCPVAEANAGLQDAKAAFFGKPQAQPQEAPYRIDAASQGQEAFALVQRAQVEKQPYALAFVDVRMPPGWDGVETISRLWEVDPELQCVICTAYADYSWDEMVRKLGRTDKLLILKKPFDPIEVCQLASAMTEKWSATRRARERLDEVKRAEMEARAYASSLVTMNRAVDAARARAETALQAKAETLVNMSQEIRTPLLAILGYAELLRTADLADAQRLEHAGMIHRQGESLLTVLSDLFDLASIESGTLTISSCPVAPLEVVRSVFATLGARASQKGLELTSACATRIPSTIQTDPTRLRQVLHNLVDNAIKFTDTGSVRVSLSLVDQEGSEPKLRLDVIDTGTGISPDLHGRLFEAFNGTSGAGRLNPHENGGAGLGLVLSKRLCRLLGGDLHVESTPGQGTTFSASVRTGNLSGASLIDHPRAPLPSSRPGAEAEAADLAHAHILMIEDVAATQRLFRHFLESAGARVEVASDGREGVDRALAADQAGDPFDLVLMDIQMPVLDGYGATRELRSKGFRKPIVAVTACAMSGDRERCLEAGCDGYASKPLGRKELLDTCDATLKKLAPPIGQSGSRG